MNGRLILMGSGELAPGMVKVHRAGIAAAGDGDVVVIDSPFGFQENVEQLTGRIVEFFDVSLSVAASVASLRSAVDDPAVREAFISRVAGGRYVFAGPGSPSYALSVWSQAGMGPVLRERLLAGATVTLASAAALTAGLKTIPVYEIYKVGADPFWLDGLDLTAPFGFSFVAVPHWNNREGGDHDTSHCYVGTRRFDDLRSELEVGVVGVDEHTAAIFDFDGRTMSVSGAGTVTIQGPRTVTLDDGESLSLDDVVEIVGDVSASESVRPAPRRRPEVEEAIAAHDPGALLSALLTLEEEAGGSDEARAALRTALTRTVEVAGAGIDGPERAISDFVELLLHVRTLARTSGDYATGDLIRDRLVDLGLEVNDGSDGTAWRLIEG